MGQLHTCIVLFRRISSWLVWKHTVLNGMLRGIYYKIKLDDIQVLHKSANFIVVNKHYDIAVNSDDKSRLTVEKQLCYLHPELVDPSAGNSFRFVHRLDFSTSGVLALALHRRAAAWAQNAFVKRSVKKHYLALLRGHLQPANGSSVRWVISGAIGKDGVAQEAGAYHMCLANNPNCKKPRSAQTEMLLLQHGLYQGKPASKVLLIPHTGRTHQLRIHCAALGHHIVGDYTYSRPRDCNVFRMMLHSQHLCLPLTKEHVEVSTPDPFTPESDPLWKPQRTFIAYDEWEEFCQAEPVVLCVDGTG